MPCLLVLLLTVTVSSTVGSAAPDGQLTWGVHVSLAPTWLDPAEAPGIVTPYMIYYALHDALVKPMPGQPEAPSLAESWSVSKDGLVSWHMDRAWQRVRGQDPEGCQAG
jgi:peptide/nickel transport system substrate-binding protein